MMQTKCYHSLRHRCLQRPESNNSVKKGKAIMVELEQLLYRKVMEGHDAKTLTKQQKKAALKYLMFLKEKCCGKIKG